MADLLPRADARRPSRRGPGPRPVRVLFLVHNHPAFNAGGAEIYALNLHRAMQASDRFESLLLAAASEPHFPKQEGQSFNRVSPAEPTELVWSVGRYDHFYMTGRDKRSYTRDLRPVLEEFRPHVVHVQHAVRLGLEALAEVRRTCPETPIVYTLHEFFPICSARGIMLRRDTGERCDGASPWRCHQCFPDRSPEEFVLRERFIKGHLEAVDLFLAPSHSLISRYVDWGISPERIRFHEYGRRIPPPPSFDAVDTRKFVFLGQAVRHKGILVLLKAAKLLSSRSEKDFTVYIDGTNMAFDGDAYVDEVKRKLDECEGRVVFRGSYTADEIPERLREVAWVLVPSIWWENSPLVIQEAFMYGRPVICSNIGGMAEKVEDGVNGLHFRAGDPDHLAEVMAEAAGNDELWRRLQKGIPDVFSLDEALDELEQIYGELLRKRSFAPVA